MRFIRARGLLRGASPAVALVFAIGCSAGSESGEQSSLTVVVDGTVPAIVDDAAFGADDGAGPTTVDPADVRSGGDTEESSRSGADPSPALPVPPTLTSADETAGSAQTSPTTAPASPSTASTAAPTTAAPATTPTEPVASDTTSTPSTDITVDASAPSTEPTASTLATEASAPTSPPAAETDLAAAEAGSATLLNQLRAELSLAELSRTAEMDAFARDWSRQMAETGNFEHSNGPYGENIAYTTNAALTAEEAAELFHQLWIESPSHYRNMTNDTYARSGIGLYRTDNGWYGTHVFGF